VGWALLLVTVWHPGWSQVCCGCSSFFRKDGRLINRIPGFSTLRVITLALMSSGVVYLAFLNIVMFPGEGNHDLTLPLGCAAMFSAVFTFFVPRLLLQITSKQAGIQGAVSAFQANKVIQLGVCESIFLFGFVAAYLAHDPRLCVPFIVVGELLMVVHFPRQVVFESGLSDQDRIDLAAHEAGWQK
jgi:hypothetical protein